MACPDYPAITMKEADFDDEPLVCETCGEEMGVSSFALAARAMLLLHRIGKNSRLDFENTERSAERELRGRRKLPKLELVGHNNLVTLSEYQKRTRRGGR